MGLYQGEVTEQHGEVSSERRPVVECASISMPALGLPMCGKAATASVRLIHHVVMQQSELMQQLEGRRGLTISACPGRPISPPDARYPQ